MSYFICYLLAQGSPATNILCDDYSREVTNKPQLALKRFLHLIGWSVSPEIPLAESLQAVSGAGPFLSTST